MTAKQAVYLLAQWGVKASEDMSMEELDALVARGKPKLSTLELDPEFGETLRAARETEEREEYERNAAKAGVIKDVIKHISAALEVVDELQKAKDVSDCNLAVQKMKNCFDDALLQA